jgi:F0F1-type ATP synthase assembly protein I
MLWAIAALFLILWLVGFTLGIGGGMIHFLPIVAMVVFIFKILSTRRFAG